MLLPVSQVPTIACCDLGLRPCTLPNQDGKVGVGFLHLRIIADDEIPAPRAAVSMGLHSLDRRIRGSHLTPLLASEAWQRWILQVASKVVS